MAKKSTETAQTKPAEKATPGIAVEGKSTRGYMLWLFCLVAFMLIFFSLVSYDSADWPGHAVVPHNKQPHNWIGAFGAVVSHHTYLLLGPGVWIIIASWVALLVATARRRPITQPVLRTIGVVMMALTTSAIVGFHLPTVTGKPEGSGGLIALFINTELYARFNTLGTMILLGTAFWVGALLAVDEWVLALPRLIKRISESAALAYKSMPKLSLPTLPQRAQPAMANVSQSHQNTPQKQASPAPFTPDAAPKASGVEGVHLSQSPVKNPLRIESRATSTLGSDGSTSATSMGGMTDPSSTESANTTLMMPSIAELFVNTNEPGDMPLTTGRAEKNTTVMLPISAQAQHPTAPPPKEQAESHAGVPVVNMDPPPGAAGTGEEIAEEIAEDANPKDWGNIPTPAAAVAPAPGSDLPDAPAAFVENKAIDTSKMDPDSIRNRIAALPINIASNKLLFPPKPAAEPARQPVDLSGYKFPGEDLLIEAEANFSVEIQAIVQEQAVQLQSALKEYKIDGEVVGIDSGPVVTLFEVRLAPGTKVASLGTVSTDLARAMKAQNIRIVPTMQGKDTIGIEVPNIKKEKVRLRELVQAYNNSDEKKILPMFLGKDASGNPLIEDLTKMPHMLIAGTTGSGKSVCMNSIIMSFLLTKRPDELKLVLVDPKMVEMAQFRDIPHLMCPVVTEMSKASAILEWAVEKMEERYELLMEAGVRDIGSYNALGWEGLKERFNPQSPDEEARIPKKLCYMVFVIDELADLMMTNKEVEGSIVRIAQKARAVGLHLILATQRPQANVVTGLIKGNMPCRISMKVASRLDSRIVLDQSGAELLLGHGDMLMVSPRSSKLTRAQGTLVDDMEIRHSVKFLKEIAQQDFEPQLVQIRSAGAGVDPSERDELFEDAVEVILETQQGSVSLLQRRFGIGYGKASRIIDQIVATGILGPHKTGQAREVLVTAEEWGLMKAQMQQQSAGAPSKGGQVYAKQDGSDVMSDSREGKKEDWANAGDDDDDSVPDEYDNEFRN